jgi:uncharacterized protein (DUF1800 family)
MTFSPDLAAIRFGTGLSPRTAPPRDPEAMMAFLLGPDRAAREWPQPGWDETVARAIAWGRLRTARDEGEAQMEAFRKKDRAIKRAKRWNLGTILMRAAGTRDGFRERLHWFWSDHFSVADEGGLLRGTVTGFEEDALRPHLTGRFAEMLHAAVTHPAMLRYLDGDRSVGPNSRRARRGRGGLNENLAREVLELHTLGAGAAYGQGDVRALAELLAGLSLDRETGAATFREAHVEPGAETVLARTYAGDDAGAVRAALDDLAVHPATARHVSAKLVRHFVADDPDPALVDAVTATWMRTDGDLPSVYQALLHHPLAHDPRLRKVRRPLEMVAAAIRALDAGPALLKAGHRVLQRDIVVPLGRMGQPFQRPPGPDGYPEEAEAWITPPALAARIDWAMNAPTLVPALPDPRAFALTALGPFATSRTRFAAEAAEARADGIGLVLAAPEFQRR